MMKNKIDGVKPFNEFLYKSCYYHQLMAALECFGIKCLVMTVSAACICVNTSEIFLNLGKKS